MRSHSVSLSMSVFDIFTCVSKGIFYTAIPAGRG